jgi:hemoglobin
MPLRGSRSSLPQTCRKDRCHRSPQPTWVVTRFFANTDVPSFKAKLVDQICEVSGGPCKYTGKDMKTAHAGMGITDADFNALVEDLVATLDKFKVPEKEKSELLGALAPMKKDIVTR